MEWCELCHKQLGTEGHHVYFGSANRKQSEKWGMVARLCPDCHRWGKEAVHSYRKNDLILKRKYQAIFEQEHTREEFVTIFGRNYL